MDQHARLGRELRAASASLALNMNSLSQAYPRHVSDRLFTVLKKIDELRDLMDELLSKENPNLTVEQGRAYYCPLGCEQP